MVTSVTAIPSLEAAQEAAVSAIERYWWDAADEVTAASPQADAPLEAPTQLTLSGMPENWYDVPSDWPSVFCGMRNLHREGDPDAPLGNYWRGTLEFRIWVENDDPARLARMLARYAATVWLCLVTADANRELSGATLLHETVTINPFAEPGETIAQQAVVMLVDVKVWA